MKARVVVKVFWWRPAWPARSLATEAIYHRRAWWKLVRHGRPSLSNFGDAASPLLVEAITGRRVDWSPIDKADVVAVGSVLDSYLRRRSGAMILGTGMRSQNAAIDAHQLAQERVLSVRGGLTRTLLGLKDSTPTGDIGLLMGGLFRFHRSVQKSPLLIPHFTEFNNRRGIDLIAEAKRNGYRVILPNEEPRKVAQAVAVSPLVVTSSLHGLVFADSYGIPGKLVTFAASKKEPEFKFRDYASVFEDTPQFSDAREVIHQGTSTLIDSVEGRTTNVRMKLDKIVNGIFTVANKV